jgi:hypothetical protein
MMWKKTPVLAAVRVMLSLVISHRVEAASVIDLTRPPDRQQIAGIVSSGKLPEFRNALGDAIAINWKPAQSGRPGSCGLAAYGRWVDLYRWVDLLESDETVVTKQWLSLHLQLGEKMTLQGKQLQVEIIGSGYPLNHDPERPDLFDKITSDGSLLEEVTGKLVAQPFTPRHGLLANRIDSQFLAETLSDPDFLSQWSTCFREENFAPKVVLNLQEIWKSNRDAWHEFLPLALALAIVKDQPAPDFWPHRQVRPDEVPRAEIPPSELFSQWISAFHNGKLRTDPRLLSVNELKFVVDAPLDSSELDWVRTNPSLARQDPARAFESITYDRGRVIKDVYVWPWGDYRLAAILEHGGICVDQAYYASITGKALGIPTIFLSGQGKDGGHAWIGYLKGPERWDFNVARYADEDYATGEAFDPQGWTKITDHDLELLSRHLGNRDPQDAARRDLVIASDFRRKGDSVNEGRALESALQECPENPDGWDAREEWLGRTGAPTAALNSFHEAAIAQFSRFNDLKVRHQQALIRLALKSGQQQSAQELTEQIVHENRAGWSREARTDLSASAAWSLISSRMQGKDVAGAVEEFERQLHLQGTGGGGDFCYAVVFPLAQQFIASGQRALALRILKEAFTVMRPEKDSLVDRDFRKLWNDAGGAPSHR